MATLFRPEPPRPSWWNAHGEDVCLVAAILCAATGIGMFGLVALLRLWGA